MLTLLCWREFAVGGAELLDMWCLDRAQLGEGDQGENHLGRKWYICGIVCSCKVGYIISDQIMHLLSLSIFRS